MSRPICHFAFTFFTSRPEVASPSLLNPFGGKPIIPPILP